MIGFLDLPSGISGDMFLGCLVDAGWPVTELEAVVAQLGLPPQSWSIRAAQVHRQSLRATLVTVNTAPESHHRHLSDIRRILDGSTLPEPIQARSLAVFTRLAAAEAAVHGTSLDEVAFHEVGALDAIIDIVGTVAGLAALGIEQLYASALPLGDGWAQSAHGRIPVPAPATLALLAEAQAATRPAPGPGELVTPTGAALLAECATFAQPPMQLRRIASGAGQKDFPWPNLARLWLGRPTAQGSLVELQTNIDDMNPELYAAVSHSLFAAGALDVWSTPIQMKKERPGVLLSVLAPATQEASLVGVLLRESTTLGVRVHELRRHTARRELQPCTCPYGTVQVKLKWVDDELVGAKPEFADCQRLAEQQGVPVRQVYEAAQAAAYSHFLAPHILTQEEKR